MLTAHHLTKSYGIQTILQDISFSVSAGERIGLIGPNGCGKSTLMRLLAGLESPDSGTILQTRPGLRVGYLSQGFEPAPRQTIANALSLLKGAVLAVVHDRYFINNFAQEIWSVENGGIRKW